MEIDLLPSSAFTPDPSVARARPFRDGLTLTLALNAQEPDASSLLAGAVESTSPGIESFRIEIDHPNATAVTITF